MSLAVCRKRSFSDDISPSASPSLTKKHRFSSAGSPPALFSGSSLVDHLRINYPTMSVQVIEKALLDCGFDLDATIRRLDELRLSYPEGNSGSAVEDDDTSLISGGMSTDEQSVPVEAASTHNLPTNGSEWVELLVKEMAGATTMDDARACAARVLEALEKSIYARAGTEAVENSMKLKEKNDVLLQENTCLKRAVVLLSERQKDYDIRRQELEQLKQLVDNYKGQMSALEVKNYALTMYLQQAQQNNSMHGHFNPDVF